MVAEDQRSPQATIEEIGGYTQIRGSLYRLAFSMSEQPPLRHYVELLRRRAWLIASFVALALGAAALATAVQTPVYRASMGMVVGQGGGLVRPEFGGTVEPFTRTLSNLLRTNVIAERVVANLDLDISPDELLADIRVQSKPESSVLDVSYDSTDRETAVAVVTEIGTVFTAEVEDKLGPGQTDRGSGTPGITARVFDPAHLEPGRVSPRPVRTLAFVGILALVLAIALAFVRDSLDDRIRRPKEAEEWFGAPVVGTLPHGIHAISATARKIEPQENGGVIQELRLLAASARAGRIERQRRDVFEALQLLCAKLQFSHAPLRGPAIVITSAQEEEGKSTVAANLSVALAAAGRDVVCVGADFHRPTLHEYFNLPSDAPGLIDVMQRRAEFADVFQSVPLRDLVTGDGRRPTAMSSARRGVRSGGAASAPRGRLRAITAGRVEPGAVRLFDDHRLAMVMDGLRASAEYVIFDSPPVLLVGDAYPLLVAADSVIVVARSGWTSQGTAEAVRATLESLGVEHVGVILTDSEERVDFQYAADSYHRLELTSARETSGSR